MGRRIETTRRMKSRRVPFAQCLLLYVEPSNWTDDASTSASQGPPAPAAASESKAYVLTPEYLLLKRPELLEIMARNKTHLLDWKTATSLSPSALQGLRMLELRFLAQPGYPSDPLDVAAPSNRGPLLTRLWSATPIRAHDIRRCRPVSAIDWHNRRVWQYLLSQAPDMPCSYGVHSEGYLRHFCAAAGVPPSLEGAAGSSDDSPDFDDTFAEVRRVLTIGQLLALAEEDHPDPEIRAFIRGEVYKSEVRFRQQREIRSGRNDLSSSKVLSSGNVSQLSVGVKP